MERLIALFDITSGYHVLVVAAVFAPLCSGVLGEFWPLYWVGPLYITFFTGALLQHLGGFGERCLLRAEEWHVQYVKAFRALIQRFSHSRHAHPSSVVALNPPSDVLEKCSLHREALLRWEQQCISPCDVEAEVKQTPQYSCGLFNVNGVRPVAVAVSAPQVVVRRSVEPRRPSVRDMMGDAVSDVASLVSVATPCSPVEREKVSFQRSKFRMEEATVADVPVAPEAVVSCEEVCDTSRINEAIASIQEGEKRREQAREEHFQKRHERLEEEVRMQQQNIDHQRQTLEHQKQVLEQQLREQLREQMCAQLDQEKQNFAQQVVKSQEDQGAQHQIMSQMEQKLIEQSHQMQQMQHQLEHHGRKSEHQNEELEKQRQQLMQAQQHSEMQQNQLMAQQRKLEEQTALAQQLRTQAQPQPQHHYDTVPHEGETLFGKSTAEKRLSFGSGTPEEPTRKPFANLGQQRARHTDPIFGAKPFGQDMRTDLPSRAQDRVTFPLPSTPGTPMKPRKQSTMADNDLFVQKRDAIKARKAVENSERREHLTSFMNKSRAEMRKEGVPNVNVQIYAKPGGSATAARMQARTTLLGKTNVMNDDGFSIQRTQRKTTFNTTEQFLSPDPQIPNEDDSRHRRAREFLGIGASRPRDNAFSIFNDDNTV